MIHGGYVMSIELACINDLDDIKKLYEILFLICPSYSLNIVELQIKMAVF